MKIFLDVGGHRGETLETVLSPICKFDLVHCFEPNADLADFIKIKFADDIASEKLQVHNFGLADFNGEQKLYGEGEGASLFADKQDINNQHFLTCKFVNVSKFLKENTDKSDLIILKMNCEGGEVLILLDLMKSGLIHNIHFAYIDFDIVKIPSKKREKRKVLKKLKAIGFNKFITNKAIDRAINSADRTKRILYAIPDANEFIDLSQCDITTEILRCYLPAIIYRKILRKRDRMHKKIESSKQAAEQ